MKVLHRHGVADENMIVMMYDDIAYSPDNPQPGEIYNQLGGENVYAGVKKGSKHSSLFPFLTLALSRLHRRRCQR